MRRKVEVFKDKKGEYRWRLISSKRIIACSGEGYTKKAGAKQGFKAVVRAITGDDVDTIPLEVVDLTVKVRAA